MNKDGNKLLIAITGGIGTGKTTLAQLIEKKRFPVIYTDQLAKDIINTNSNVKELITSTFGSNAFFNGEYNSIYIATIVFNDDKKLEQLNQIILPHVIDKLIDTIDSLQSSNCKIIFIETALLFEMNLEKGFDYVISVSASAENRKKRLLENRKLTEKDIEKRMKKQMSQEEKDRRSDFVINNDGNYIALKHSIDTLIPILSMLPNKDFDSE